MSKTAIKWAAIVAVCVVVVLVVPDVWEWITVVLGAGVADEIRKKRDKEPYDDPPEDDVEDVPDTSGSIDDYIQDVHNRGE